MNNNLRERRLALELSQPDVVRMIREEGHTAMDVSLYSKIENGHCLPNYETLPAIEKALQADRTALFSTDELFLGYPAEAQQGGFRWERTSSGETDASALAGDEGCAACEDAPDEAYMPQTNAQQPYVTMLAGAIPFGRRNAIHREILAEKLGMSDRAVRRAIEEARAAGIIILNDQNGRGYYQSDDLLEMRRQYQQDTARAMSILKRRKPLRERLKAAGVQV